MRAAVLQRKRGAGQPPLPHRPQNVENGTFQICKKKNKSKNPLRNQVHSYFWNDLTIYFFDVKGQKTFLIQKMDYL